MSSRVRLRLIGGFDLVGPTRESAKLPRKTRGLIAYLAAQRGRPVHREVVGELLWSGRGREQIRHSLHQALGDLRRQLPSVAIITSQADGLRLADGVSSDLEDLLKLIGSNDPDELRIASELYSGPLLDNFPMLFCDFDNWLITERTRVETLMLDALSRLELHNIQIGDITSAIVTVEKMYSIDPLREDVHRRLLETYGSAGRRSEALRRYDEIVDHLRGELDVAPSIETRQLANRLRCEAGSPVKQSPPLVPMVTGVPADSTAPSVAVLPLQQLTEENFPSYLADGLTTDIICQLAGLRELAVISYGSTLALKDPTLDPYSVGRMLGTRYIVRGSIRISNDQMRLTSELVETETGVVVWTRSFDTHRLMSFEEQDRIVAHLVNALVPRIRQVELTRIRGKRPENLSIYERVLLARELLSTIDRENFNYAKTLLDEVLAADPGYAECYALLSNWHSLIVGQGWSTDRQADVFAVERRARQALELDSDNVRALVLYGHRRSLLHRDYSMAQEMFERALSVMPSSALAWVWSSFTSSYVGNVDEAFRRASRGLELSPRDREAHIFLSAFCVANYVARNYRSAAEWGIKALRERFVLGALYRYVAAALAACGELSYAREIAMKGMQIMPNECVSDIVHNCAFREDGQRDTFRAHLHLAGYPG